MSTPIVEEIEDNIVNLVSDGLKYISYSGVVVVFIGVILAMITFMKILSPLLFIPLPGGVMMLVAGAIAALSGVAASLYMASKRLRPAFIDLSERYAEADMGRLGSFMLYYGSISIALGLVSSITIIGAIIGIPLAILGVVGVMAGLALVTISLYNLFGRMYPEAKSPIIIMGVGLAISLLMIILGFALLAAGAYLAHTRLQEVSVEVRGSPKKVIYL